MCTQVKYNFPTELELHGVPMLTMYAGSHDVFKYIEPLLG